MSLGSQYRHWDGQQDIPKHHEYHGFDYKSLRNYEGVLKWVADGYISVHSHTKEDTRLHANKTVNSIDLSKALRKADGLGIQPEDGQNPCLLYTSDAADDPTLV